VLEYCIRKTSSATPQGLFKMPVPVGANMGGPSNFDKCMFLPGERIGS
jgi:hypothetical protein